MSDPIYVSDEQRAAFLAASQAVYDAHAALSRAWLALLPFTDGGGPVDAALTIIGGMEDSTRGRAYGLHPQAEWMGGPPEVSVTRYRWPHDVSAAARTFYGRK